MTKRRRQHEKQGRYTDGDGYKGKKVSPTHQPTTALIESPSGALIARAVKEGWMAGDRWKTAITVEELQELQKDTGFKAKDRAMLAILTDLGSEEGNRRQRAVANLIRMEGQNQGDDHLVAHLAQGLQHTQAQAHVHVHGDAIISTDDRAARIVEVVSAEIAQRTVSD